MTEKTDLIKRYYQEYDPMKRRRILEKSIQQGEDPERNQLRMELWELRYQEPSKAVKGGRSDGFLLLWMNLKYADGNTGGFLIGTRRTIKEIKKTLEKLQIVKWKEKGGLYEECLYEECCHLMELYIYSCVSDKNYSSGLLGLMALPKEKVDSKITSDMYGAAIRVPRNLNLEKELDIITRAAKEVYSRHYPVDEFDEPTEHQKELLS